MSSILLKQCLPFLCHICMYTRENEIIPVLIVSSLDVNRLRPTTTSTNAKTFTISPSPGPFWEVLPWQHLDCQD